MQTLTLNRQITDLNITSIDDTYRIESNNQYPGAEGNCYLILNSTRHCLGSVTRSIEGGEWQTSILVIPDDGYTSVSEAIFVGDYDSAIETLWVNRDQAYKY